MQRTKQGVIRNKEKEETGPVIIWSLAGVYFQRKPDHTFDYVKITNTLDFLLCENYSYGKKNIWAIWLRSAHLREQKVDSCHLDTRP